MNNYKNRIKKFLTYIVCIVSLISLYACNNINSLDDSEFIIIDNNNIYGIEKKDNKFVVNSSQEREKEILNYGIIIIFFLKIKMRILRKQVQIII